MMFQSSCSSQKLETKRSETALLINGGNVNRELQMTFLSSFFFFSDEILLSVRRMGSSITDNVWNGKNGTLCP